MTQIGWLSEEELVFHRMLTFHRERIAELSANTQMNSHVGKGILIVHLIPKQSIVARTQVATKQLKEYGSRVRPLGEQGGSSRFNVDGFMNYSGRDELRAYSQIFRDGRIEAVMSDAAYSRRNETNAFVLRDRVCEKGVMNSFAVTSHSSPHSRLSRRSGCSPPYSTVKASESSQTETLVMFLTTPSTGRQRSCQRLKSHLWKRKSIRCSNLGVIRYGNPAG